MTLPALFHRFPLPGLLACACLAGLTACASPDPALPDGLPPPVLEVPVTHAKVFAWYDNEYGSYTNALGDLTVHVHSSL